jgi:hypothetical protein
MQVQNFADLAKLIQNTIEEYFGLSAKVEPGRYCPSKAYKPLCKKLGVGVLGAEVILQSPTGKPVEALAIAWDFQIGGTEGDEDNEEYQENTKCPQPWFIPDSNDDRPSLTADTKVRKVELRVGYRERLRLMDLTDLRCLLREKLKGTFPEVTIKLTD